MKLRNIIISGLACLVLAGCTQGDEYEQYEPPKPSQSKPSEPENANPSEPGNTTPSDPGTSTPTEPGTSTPTVAASVFLTGDSTCAPKSESDRPKYGWGEKFSQFIIESTTVENKAVGGKSTKTYISGGQWDKMLKSVKKDDLVLIQFGHNDENTTAADNRGTTPQEFYENLCKMIQDVQAKNAVPVILTPICRHKFSNGAPVYTHQTYPEMAKKAANDKSVPVLDIEQLTYEWLNRLGEETSKLRYMMSVEGSSDTTHLTELGATEIAEIVAKAMKASSDTRLSAVVR